MNEVLPPPPQKPPAYLFWLLELLLLAGSLGGAALLVWLLDPFQPRKSVAWEKGVFLEPLPDGRCCRSKLSGATTVVDSLSGETIGSYRAGGRTKLEALAADASAVALVNDDDTLRLLKLPSGQEAPPPDFKLKRVCGLAISGDGKQLAITDGSGAVVIWNAAERRSRRLPTPKAKGWAEALDFSPDGKILVGAWREAEKHPERGPFDHGLCVIWDLEESRLLPSPGRNLVERAFFRNEPIVALAESPDRNGAGPLALRFWDYRKGELRGSWPQSTRQFGLPTVSADGRLVAIAQIKYESEDLDARMESQSVVIREWPSGAVRCELPGHVDPHFLPDNRTLLTRSGPYGHDAMHLWDQEIVPGGAEPWHIPALAAMFFLGFNLAAWAIRLLRHQLPERLTAQS